MNKDYFVQLNIQDDFDKHIGVVKLNETDSVTLNINLVQNGTPFDLTTANYVTMAVIKPDQSFNNGYCEIVDGPAGKIKYVLPTNCVNQTGVFRGEVQAFNNTSMISTAAFSYEVKNSLLRDEGVTTQPEYPILVQLIEQVQGAVTAEVGRVSAENGRVSAESARVTAESGRVSAESTRASNESTRQSQESARVSSESSRATAETGRVNAESARVSAENTRVSQESTRQTNESSRATAESGRVTAESNRVAAENARVSAESSRASAESTRQSNESTRQTQESNRVSSFAAIYQQYLDSISSGSVIEVVNARNGFANLDARLDDSDTKLAANTTEIQNARNGFANINARMIDSDSKLALTVSKTTAPITYYVRTDGNDANDGSANDAAHAFKTIQKAIDVLPKYLAHDVTINVAAGTFTEDVLIYGFVGNGVITITGDSIVSTSRSISSASIRGCVSQVTITGFNFTTTTTNSITITQSQRVIVNNNNMVQAFNSVPGIGIGASNVYAYNNVISNKSYAFSVGNMSKVSSYNNSGTGNTTGIYASNGAQVAKTGVQPVGTTMELVDSGGIITGDELTVTITSGFAAGWGGTITLRKSFDNLVELLIQVNKGSTQINDGDIIYTLPVGLRPIAGFVTSQIALNSGGGKIAGAFVTVEVRSTGEIVAGNWTNTPTATQIYAYRTMYYSA